MSFYRLKLYSFVATEGGRFEPSVCFAHVTEDAVMAVEEQLADPGWLWIVLRAGYGDGKACKVNELDCQKLLDALGIRLTAQPVAS